MKSIISPLFLILVLFISACSTDKNTDFHKVEEAAKHDVAKVTEAPEGSMQREHAILAIRVREHALRDAGYDAAADKYLEVAENLLIDSLHIIKSPQIVNQR